MKPSSPLVGIAAQPVAGVGAVGTLGVPQTAGLAPWAPHLGHALRPCVRRTFSATRICSARDAVAGLPTPPFDDQVACLNCRPPYAPLPELVAQLPPDSHRAMASQFTLSALAVPVESAIGMTPRAPAMAAANRPLVNALRMFITAVLPRPFETRPAVEQLRVLRCGYLMFRVINITRYASVKSFNRYLS